MRKAWIIAACDGAATLAEVLAARTYDTTFFAFLDVSLTGNVSTNFLLGGRAVGALALANRCAGRAAAGKTTPKRAVSVVKS